MKNFRYGRFMENMNVAQFQTAGLYDTPVLLPENYAQSEFIGFNYAKSEKEKQKKSIHFFVDDYQFERVWRNPEQYIGILSQFKQVLTPDFSLYTDYPKALQIYNHYRKQWLGAYWQANGIHVIPTVAWSDKDSFEWCFDGIPVGGAVAVSSVGTQKKAETKALFAEGYAMMIEKLHPSTIVFHGIIPEGCDGNIIKIEAHQERLKMEVKANGR